jgi:two-component system, NarL family, sensor histidine kinase UhpB
MRKVGAIFKSRMGFISAINCTPTIGLIRYNPIMSLRLRLNLLITALLLLFMLAVGYVNFNGTKSSIQEGVEAATRVTVQLLDTVIVSSAQNPEWGYTHDVMYRFLEQLGHVRGNEIFLYDVRGHLMHQSPPSKYRANENPPKWFIDALDPHEKSVTRFLHFGRLEVVPNPAGGIREAWGKLRILFWVGLGFFVVLNFAVYWMLGHWLRPLQPILTAINKMEQGDLTPRLASFDLPEFEKIGHSLNRMAESLAAERQLEENRQLTALIQSHIEDERRSLARELHDGLGQYVTAIKTFAVAIANKTKDNAPDISGHAQTIVGAANHIYDGMHDIIRQLRPGSLDNLGLGETLRDMVNQTQKQHSNLKVNLTLLGKLDGLGENLNINLFRIVQESINNAIKHADAKNIDIKLEATKTGDLQLTISDDGRGMDIDAVDHSNHFGLLGMRERVQGFKGSFHLNSEPNTISDNKGTTIYINIPQATPIKDEVINEPN